MLIYTNDPFPGRCHNYRVVEVQTYKTVRCLGYENEKHYCFFPEQLLKNHQKNDSYFTSSNVTQPKPWVAPSEKNEK